MQTDGVARNRNDETAAVGGPLVEPDDGRGEEAETALLSIGLPS